MVASVRATWTAGWRFLEFGRGSDALFQRDVYRFLRGSGSRGFPSRRRGAQQNAMGPFSLVQYRPGDPGFARRGFYGHFGGILVSGAGRATHPW